MSEVNTNTKLVPVNHEVPRKPNDYRATIHFGQQLRARAPADKRDRIVEECIKFGKCRGASPTQAGDTDGVKHFFAFDREIGEEEWTVVVGIVPEAFLEPTKKHLAVTVYPTEDDDE